MTRSNPDHLYQELTVRDQGSLISEIESIVYKA